MANFLAQTEALMQGKNKETVNEELVKANKSPEEIEVLLPFKIFKGNQPTNTLIIDALTPESLGKLVSMYEHKIFVQGVIWNIFSYDQWGVELGKQLASVILTDITKETKNQHDQSTQGLLNHLDA